MSSAGGVVDRWRFTWRSELNNGGYEAGDASLGELDGKRYRRLDGHT
jgi:hypothetical protein